MNHYGEPDVAMFDFTSMYAAENACRAKKIVTWNKCTSCSKQHSTKKMRKTESREWQADALTGAHVDDHVEAEMRESLLLVGLVGDSLLEPFWPTGSGCGRGFLSAMDSAWMVRQWAVKECTADQEAALSVLKEREAIYRLLGQTKSENLSQNYAAYTLNPISRYPNLNSSTVFPHECRHLLYDDVHPPAAPESARLKRQSIAAKRARRATIASSSPFSGISEEKSSLAALRESDVISKPNRDDISSVDQSLEDSFADFEHNYQGLIEKSSGSSSSSRVQSSLAASSTSSSTLVNSNCNSSRSSAFNEMMLSPSASNLATLGRSRAKDIEAALRHRRQQQLVLNRKDTSPRSLSSTYSDVPSEFVSQSHSNGASQQLRSKMSWLLEQKDTSSAPLVSRDHEVVKEPAAPFASRVRNLEAKFHANSGLHSLDVSAYEKCDQKKNIMSKGSNVMTAATTLEQLLNPMQQEVRLKEKAGDYRKKTHDIKVVMKMTKETDWNKKCWEEREKQAAGKMAGSSHGLHPMFSGRRGERRKTLAVQCRIREIIDKISDNAAQDRWHSRIPFSPRRFIMSRRDISPNYDADLLYNETYGYRVFRDDDGDEDRVTKLSVDNVACDSNDYSSDASFCSYFCPLFFHFSSYCLLIAFALIFAYFSFHFGL